MVAVEDVVTDSPVRFEHAVAYALHPDMRRLIILYIVGVLLTPVGLSWFLGPTMFPLVDRLLGLAVAIIGAVCLFGGWSGRCSSSSRTRRSSRGPTDRTTDPDRRATEG